MPVPRQRRLPPDGAGRVVWADPDPNLVRLTGVVNTICDLSWMASQRVHQATMAAARAGGQTAHGGLDPTAASRANYLLLHAARTQCTAVIQAHAGLIASGVSEDDLQASLPYPQPRILPGGPTEEGWASTAAAICSSLISSSNLMVQFWTEDSRTMIPRSMWGAHILCSLESDHLHEFLHNHFAAIRSIAGPKASAAAGKALESVRKDRYGKAGLAALQLQLAQAQAGLTVGGDLGAALGMPPSGLATTGLAWAAGPGPSLPSLPAWAASSAAAATTAPSAPPSAPPGNQTGAGAGGGQAHYRGKRGGGKGRGGGGGWNNNGGGGGAGGWNNNGGGGGGDGGGGNGNGGGRGTNGGGRGGGGGGGWQERGDRDDRQPDRGGRDDRDDDRTRRGSPPQGSGGSRGSGRGGGR